MHLIDWIWYIYTLASALVADGEEYENVNIPLQSDKRMPRWIRRHRRRKPPFHGRAKRRKLLSAHSSKHNRKYFNSQDNFHDNDFID